MAAKKKKQGKPKSKAQKKQVVVTGKKGKK